MSVREYLEAIKARLLADPSVTGFQIVRERDMATDGHIRARITLSDSSLLEFSEYFQQTPEGNIQVVTYSYHWADHAQNLIRRWDNTPHHPDVDGFPHHVHNGTSGEVLAGASTNIFSVLSEINALLAAAPHP